MSKLLKIAHINIRSISKKFELQLFLQENEIDILALNETWLKQKDQFQIPNYVMIRKDRPRKKGRRCGHSHKE